MTSPTRRSGTPRSGTPRSGTRRTRLAVVGVAAALTAAIGGAGAPSAVASVPADPPVASVARDHIHHSGTTSTAAARTKTVKVRMFQFQKKTLRIDTGTRVVWNNRDQILHTVTGIDSGSDAVLIDGELDGVGAKYAVTFAEPGTYDYFCMIHTAMKGRVVVKG